MWCFWGIAFIHIWFDRTASKADSLCTGTDSRLLRQRSWSLSCTSFTLVQSHRYQPFRSGSTFAAQTCVNPGPKVSLWKPAERRIAKRGERINFSFDTKWIMTSLWDVVPFPTVGSISHNTLDLRGHLSLEDEALNKQRRPCGVSYLSVLPQISGRSFKLFIHWCSLRVTRLRHLPPPLLAHLWVKAVSLGTLSEITDSGSRNEIKEEIGCISIRGVSLELNTHITQKHHWLLLSVTSDHHFFILTGTQAHMHHTHAHTHTLPSLIPPSPFLCSSSHEGTHGIRSDGMSFLKQFSTLPRSPR